MPTTPPARRWAPALGTAIALATGGALLAAPAAQADGIGVATWGELTTAASTGAVELLGDIHQASGTLAVPAATRLTIDLAGHRLQIDGPENAPALDASAADAEVQVIDTVGGGQLVLTRADGAAGAAGSTYVPGPASAITDVDDPDIVGVDGGTGAVGAAGGATVLGTVVVESGSVEITGAAGGAAGRGGDGAGWTPLIAGGAGGVGGPGGAAVDGTLEVNGGEVAVTGGAGGVGGAGGKPSGWIWGWYEGSSGPAFGRLVSGGPAGAGGIGGLGGPAIVGDLTVTGGGLTVAGGAGGAGGSGAKGGTGARMGCVLFGYMDDDGTPTVDPPKCYYGGFNGSWAGAGGRGGAGIVGSAELTSGAAHVTGGTGGAGGFGGEYGAYASAGLFDLFPVDPADGGRGGAGGSGGAGIDGGLGVTGGTHDVSGAAGGVAGPGGWGETNESYPGLRGRIPASGGGGHGVDGGLAVEHGTLLVAGGDAAPITSTTGGGGYQQNFDASAGGDGVHGGTTLDGGRLTATSGTGTPQQYDTSAPDGSTLVGGVQVDGTRLDDSAATAGGTAGSTFTDLADAVSRYRADVTTQPAVTVSQRHTLEVAFWHPVAFDAAGGSAVDEQLVAEGQLAAVPADPTRHGYAFGGWHLDSAAGDPWDAAEPVLEPVTVVAAWSTVPVDLRIELSDDAPDQGDTIEVSAWTVDVDGADMAEVSDEIVITSDQPTDVVDGNRVTFPHASPHVLTITAGDVTVQLTVQVTPAAVAEVPAIAATGADPMPLAASALLLLGAGAAFAAVSRIRRSAA